MRSVLVFVVELLEDGRIREAHAYAVAGLDEGYRPSRGEPTCWASVRWPAPAADCAFDGLVSSTTIGVSPAAATTR
jgi:hypothetical protein